MLQRFFFSVQFFLRAVIASAVGHNPLIRLGTVLQILSWTELSVISMQHWTSRKLQQFSRILRVSICTDDQILAESASFILARANYALERGWERLRSGPKPLPIRNRSVSHLWRYIHMRRPF